MMCMGYDDVYGVMLVLMVWTVLMMMYMGWPQC